MQGTDSSLAQTLFRAGLGGSKWLLVNVMPPVKNPNLPLRLRTLNGFGAYIKVSQPPSFPIEIPSIPFPFSLSSLSSLFPPLYRN